MASDRSFSTSLDINNLPAERLLRDNRHILIRQLAVSVIAEVSKMDYPPDAYVPYLAMKYFDLFCLQYNFMDVKDSAAIKKTYLIAVACYVLSAQRRDSAFTINDRLVAHRHIDLSWLNHNMLYAMQGIIMKKLENNMSPTTAFWFLDHFYSHFKLLGLKRRSINEIIVQAQGEHAFVDFMPTDIAFSACVAAATIALKELPEDINNMISNNASYKVEELVKKMIDLCHRMKIPIDKIKVAAYEAEKQNLAMDECKCKEVIKEPQRQIEAFISRIDPMKHMNFVLKWATDVPPLDDTNVSQPEEIDVPPQEELEVQQPLRTVLIHGR